jgi:hypothetical protein
MWMRTMAGVLSLLVVAACASAGGHEGPVQVDPVGSYTLTTVIQGSPISGQMRIEGEPGAYTGAVYTGFTGELPITAVSVDGSQVFITAETPDGPVDVQVTFDGDTFSGTWMLGPETGSIQGRRVGG